MPTWQQENQPVEILQIWLTCLSDSLREYTLAAERDYMARQKHLRQKHLRQKERLAVALLLAAAATGVASPPALADATPAAAPQEQVLNRIMHTWVTPGFGSKVTLAPCAPGQQPLELCGTITWLWQGIEKQGFERQEFERQEFERQEFDKHGEPLGDKRNPDKSARTLIGTQILSGFQLQHGVWRGGRVYNPDDGRTYSGTIRLMPDGTLQLQGCALRIFCQTQTWRRESQVCPSASD